MTTSPPRITRCPENPIVRPGELPWRMACTFNPAVLHEDGRFFLYERTAGNLRPFGCVIGLRESDDGVHFTAASDEPVIHPRLLGSAYGSVQDPRIVRIGREYLMTVAYRPYAWNSSPTGVGVPDSWQASYPGFSGNPEENQTRSAILRSTDRVHWEMVGFVNPPDVDDRNVILFPEEIGGRYAVLRRPSRHVTTDAAHEEAPAIRISFSENLTDWSEPEVVARPAFDWENNRIGGSTPPIRTDAGWLVFYHGVETQDQRTRRVCYRMGAMLLDLDDPTRILARSTQPLMEPEAYYERTGLYIPNVVFPTAAILIGDEIRIYYGCCDTAIGLATVSLRELLDYLGG